MPHPEATRKPTFNTIERENSFRHPTNKGSTYKILNEFVTPHIESFNSLFDDSGLPNGDGDGKGLISLGLRDIGERVVFDGVGGGFGNRMRSTPRQIRRLIYIDLIAVWIEHVSISRPIVGDRAGKVSDSRIFPSEV